MCVIACYDKNRPKLKDLEAMEKLNNDGAGIAWIKDGKVHYEKGITSKEIWNLVNKVKIPLPFVIHFRIKSVGSIVPELTHPFEITTDMNDNLSGDVESVLFHNGTYTNWDEDLLTTCMNQGLKIPSGHLSDSKALAFLCAIYGENYLKLIKTTSRFTVFTKDGFKRFGDWKEVSGGYCSNDHHDIKETNVSTWKPNTRWFQGKYRSEEEIKKLEDQFEQEMEEKSKQTHLTVKTGKNECKIMREDGKFNVWNNKGELIRIEDDKGIITHEYQNDLEDDQIIDISDRVDNLNLFDMTDEEQKIIYEKSCNELIKIESKIIALKCNITNYEHELPKGSDYQIGTIPYKDQMKADKLKKKIDSSKKRIEKAKIEKQYNMTILEELAQNSDNIEPIDQDNFLNDALLDDYVGYI